MIGIIGLGYVGLPLALRFSEAGYSVLGFDTDQRKIGLLDTGKTYIQHIGNDRVRLAVDAGLRATSDLQRVSEADALILCLPTPLKAHREPDLGFVISTLESIMPHLRSGQVLSLESTTYPGTTEEEIKSRLQDAGFKVGADVFLVYSPEREDPGNSIFNTKNIPKLVSGSTPDCLEVGLSLYSRVIDQLVPVSGTATAEMAKLLENIHRAVNIGLVNEMKIVADAMGIDIYEVIEAAASKPFGFVPYYPGPGLGGHCIPIDPFYLTWKAREYGVNTRFIELAGEVNSAMPAWVVNKTADALNSVEKAVNGSRILVLGISYKKNIDDVRESPAVAIMQQLQDKGAQVAYCDPYFEEFPPMRQFHFSQRSEPFTRASLSQVDCVVITADHDCFDYDLLLAHAPLIVDTRGRIKGRHRHVFRA